MNFLNPEAKELNPDVIGETADETSPDFIRHSYVLNPGYTAPIATFEERVWLDGRSEHIDPEQQSQPTMRVLECMSFGRFLDDAEYFL